MVTMEIIMVTMEEIIKRAIAMVISLMIVMERKTEKIANMKTMSMMERKNVPKNMMIQMRPFLDVA